MQTAHESSTSTIVTKQREHLGPILSLHVPPVAVQVSPGSVCCPPAVRSLTVQENCILIVSLSVCVSAVKGQKTSVQCQACLSPQCVLE